MKNIIKPLLKFGLLAALLGYVYFPTFLWMVDRWSARDSYYGHGFLIPLVSLFWIFQKRKALHSAPKETGKAGFAVLLAGGLIQVASSFLRIYFLSAMSFVIILLGAVYYLYGKKVFREVWFPVAFLLLMIPLPLLAISEITLKMKFFVSEISTYLINSTGIEAIRQGSYIYMPHSVLLVGDPCSGLRSFLAFLCLGLVFAYDKKLRFWQKSVLVSVGLPLAVSSNVVRVWFLGLVAEIYGMQHTGPGSIPHDAGGVAVFVMAFLVFLLIRKKMESLNVRLG